jgi:hypothetical protein
LPIGQAFFVPREKMRDGTEDEIAARQKSSEAFFHDKAAAKVKTAYGLEHSPHYLRKSRQQNAAPEVRPTGVNLISLGREVCHALDELEELLCDGIFVGGEKCSQSAGPQWMLGHIYSSTND